MLPDRLEYAAICLRCVASMSDVTQSLSQIESGDPSAAAEPLPPVYNELRKLAAAKLADENPAQTLQATALEYEMDVRSTRTDFRSD